MKHVNIQSMNRPVIFVATKYKEEPVQVAFYTKDGDRVSFATRKDVSHKEIVHFNSDGKRKK